MPELTTTILAAEEGGGQSNFLVPNGTFFAVLLIFLITLAVVWKWVVPPVGKVLAAREAMLAKTTADNRKSAEQLAAAQADFDEKMSGARGEASAIRDEARTAGRKVIELDTQYITGDPGPQKPSAWKVAAVLGGLLFFSGALYWLHSRK